jgi:hypothetical protein
VDVEAEDLDLGAQDEELAADVDDALGQTVEPDEEDLESDADEENAILGIDTEESEGPSRAEGVLDRADWFYSAHACRPAVRAAAERAADERVRAASGRRQARRRRYKRRGDVAHYPGNSLRYRLW